MKLFIAFLITTILILGVIDVHKESVAPSFSIHRQPLILLKTSNLELFLTSYSDIGIINDGRKHERADE